MPGCLGSCGGSDFGIRGWIYHQDLENFGAIKHYTMSMHKFPILLITLSLFPLILRSQSEKDWPEIRNIVVILADDHALKVTGAYGNDIIRTPNIDRLSGQGLTFNRAYCNAPICSASRASLLTGKYPHATGVNLLFTPFPDEGNQTIAEHLQKQGYGTALFGKTHFNNWIWGNLYENGLPDHGFDTLVERGEYRDWLASQEMPPSPENLDYYRGNGSRDNVAEWMNWRVLPQPIYDQFSEGTFYTRQAIDYIRNRKDDPFFVWLAFKEPHHPYYFPIEYAGKYDPEEVPLPTGSPEDDRWIPEKFRQLTDAERRGIIAAYYSSTEYMDKNVGLVLEALDEMKLAEETLVLYISDNGYLLNDHRRFEKHTMWEEAVHQPLIMRLGKGYRAGQTEEALIEYVDIVPTLLEVIGAETLPSVQGKSFLPVIRNDREEHREYTFSEYLEDNLAMVCTRSWKYMFTTGRRDLGIGYQTGFGPSGIVHSLYYLPSDPTESKDLSSDPVHRERLLRMQEQLLSHFMATHPEANHCPQGLSLEGKLVWFCEPRDVGAEQSLRDIPYRVFRE